MHRTRLLLLLVTCVVLAGCAAPVAPAVSPSQTPPPIQSIHTPTPEPTSVSSSVAVETLKTLWDAASAEERADLLAQAGLTSVPDEVTSELVDEAVQRAAAHGVDLTAEDAEEFLTWMITN